MYPPLPFRMCFALSSNMTRTLIYCKFHFMPPSDFSSPLSLCLSLSLSFSLPSTGIWRWPCLGPTRSVGHHRCPSCVQVHRTGLSWQTSAGCWGSRWVIVGIIWFLYNKPIMKTMISLSLDLHMHAYVFYCSCFLIMYLVLSLCLGYDIRNAKQADAGAIVADVLIKVRNRDSDHLLCFLNTQSP